MSKAQFPLKHFSDNLIFNTKGEVWAVYELKGFTYDYKGGDAKHADVNRRCSRPLHVQALCRNASALVPGDASTQFRSDYMQ